MPVGTGLVLLPGGTPGRPFTKASNAAATAQNTFTLAARANERYVLRSLVVTCAQVAVVNNPITISNILDETGALATVTFQFVADPNAGGKLQIEFGPDGLWSANNTAVVFNLPALAGTGASSIVLSGLVV